MKAPAKIVFYARLSKKKKRLKAGSTTEFEWVDDYENQIQLLRAKWGDHEIHREVVSGGGQRVVLRHLIATLPAGSTIYAVALDRITRKSIHDILDIVKNAKMRHLNVITIEDGNLTTEKEIILAVKAFAAVTERERVGDRMRNHIAARKAAGLLWGAQLAKQRGTFRNGSKPVNEAFKRALPRMRKLKKEGYAIREIAEMMSKEFGEPFSKSHVHRMLAGKIKGAEAS